MTKLVDGVILFLYWIFDSSSFSKVEGCKYMDVHDLYKRETLSLSSRDQDIKVI